MKLRIAKTFSSIQGEGGLAGVPMFFIRTAGCSVSQCPLHPSTTGKCDTDWAFVVEADIDQLAEDAEASGLLYVCITGGEPTDQMEAIDALREKIQSVGMKVMLQTSGVRMVSDKWDWLVVSPKTHLNELSQVYGHELKLVWNGEGVEYLSELLHRTRFKRHYLQPLFDPATGTTNLKDVIQAVLECVRCELPYRLSTQQHRAWGME